MSTTTHTNDVDTYRHTKVTSTEGERDVAFTGLDDGALLNVRVERPRLPGDPPGARNRVVAGANLDRDAWLELRAAGDAILGTANVSQQALPVPGRLHTFGDVTVDLGPNFGKRKPRGASVDRVNTWGANPTTAPAPRTEAAKILTKAAQIVGAEGQWTQGTLAKDANGETVVVEDPSATCFCALGAIVRAAPYARERAAIDALGDHLFATRGNRYIPIFNDAPERTQEEVVAAMKAAAKLADEQAEAGR